MSGLKKLFDKVPELPAPAQGSSRFVSCILPIAQISIGAVYLDDCPRQHYIPIYLIVAGVFGLLLAVLSCLPCTQGRADGTTNPFKRICTIWNLLAGLFLFCWFITGQVWIYSIYEPSYIKNTTDVTQYCNKTLYLFAFWSTTFVYILLAVFLVLFCCVLCCEGLSAYNDTDI